MVIEHVGTLEVVIILKFHIYTIRAVAVVLVPHIVARGDDCQGHGSSHDTLQPFIYLLRYHIANQLLFSIFIFL